MTDPRAVLFDLGGVLIDWDPRHLYGKVFGPEETERFLAEVCTGEWNLELDAGRPWAEAIAEKQAAWPRYAQAIGWWHTRWVEMLNGPIPGTVAILDELRGRGVPLYALTNWSAETFPYARQRFAFLDWFQDIVVSGEVGLVKPDPAIYRLVLHRCGLEPGNTVFIDDSPRNVAGAAALGLDAILFEAPDRLRESLKSRRLI